ncbi:hypothetical protein [Labilibaculum sp.]|uniref:hypothetical protein n=1 Tax=Labilibaculum sp. TaxID=2060723 RepID=UPI002AA72197|nr:hypothetical protein [Labilibaculum sp.]
MAKNFKSGIDALLQPSIQEKKADKEKIISVKATYYYNSEQLNTIKKIAFFDRKPIGRVISEALEVYIQSYEDLSKAQKLKR